MQHAFPAIATSSLALFGLVMATLSFGFGTAIRQLDRVEVFRRFSMWLWTAGICCCVYYSYCFIVTTRILYGSYTDAFLILVMTLATCILALGHFLEGLYLYRLMALDRPKMKWVFRTQTGLATLTFVTFLALNWTVLLYRTMRGREEALFVAMVLMLVLISFRVIFLMSFAFYSVALLKEQRLGEI